MKNKTALLKHVLQWISNVITQNAFRKGGDAMEMMIVKTTVMKKIVSPLDCLWTILVHQMNLHVPTVIVSTSPGNVMATLIALIIVMKKTVEHQHVALIAFSA